MAWKVVHDDAGIYIDTGPETSRWDCPNPDYTNEDFANALLMAVVPEMLAAAEAALPAIRWGMAHQPGNMSQWIDCEAQLQAAIAKGRGQAEAQS